MTDPRQELIDAWSDYKHEVHRQFHERDRLLIAAYQALRSYQYGNASPELAQEIADQMAMRYPELTKTL